MHNKRYSTDRSSLPPINSGSNIISHLTYFKSLITESPAAHLSPRGSPPHHRCQSSPPTRSDYIISLLPNLPQLSLTLQDQVRASQPGRQGLLQSGSLLPATAPQMPSTICSRNNTPNMTCIFMPPGLCSWSFLHGKPLGAPHLPCLTSSLKLPQSPTLPPFPPPLPPLPLYSPAAPISYVTYACTCLL